MRLVQASLALAALAGVACVRQEGVMRVVDGVVVEGAFVPPEAYAAFLRGAIAEESGNLRGAVDAYVEASRLDADDAEIWARIARVKCAIDPRDATIDAALGRAFAIDARYAGAWSARAECAAARGDTKLAEAAAKRATAEEPLAVDLEVLLARSSAGAADEATRDRLLALTLVYPKSAAAWDALAAWATARGDLALYARAISELAVVAPTRRRAFADAAAALAGAGALREARVVAAALADAAAIDGLGAPTATARPLVARLAVDEAIARGDAPLARLRSTRTHLGLDVAAARAALAGRDAVARALAGEVVAAEPGAVGARALLAALGRDVAGASAIGAAREIPAECALVLARFVADEVSDAAGADAYGAARRGELVVGDALVAPVAAGLALRGVVPATELPVDAVVELFARRGEPPPPSALADPSLDARHLYFSLARVEPTSARTAALSARLARARATDALVASAWLRERLARGQPIDAREISALLALAPADPIALAAALDAATKGADADAITRARSSLAALARTPAERARVTE